MFVFTQTVRHRDFFLPVETAERPADDDGDGHADPPAGPRGPDQPRPARRVAGGGGRTGQGRVARDRAARWPRVGFPHAFVGVVIALLVLLPESIAAVRAAARRRRADQPQPGLRLGDGLDRPDHPDHRGRLDLARRPARARPRRDRDGAAVHLGRRRGADRRPRPREAARRAASTWCCSRRSCSCRSAPDRRDRSRLGPEDSVGHARDPRGHAFDGARFLRRRGHRPRRGRAGSSASRARTTSHPTAARWRRTTGRCCRASSTPTST